MKHRPCHQVKTVISRSCHIRALGAAAAATAVAAVVAVVAAVVAVAAVVVAVVAVAGVVAAILQQLPYNAAAAVIACSTTESWQSFNGRREHQDSYSLGVTQ